MTFLFKNVPWVALPWLCQFLQLRSLGPCPPSDQQVKGETEADTTSNVPTREKSREVCFYIQVYNTKLVAFKHVVW